MPPRITNKQRFRRTYIRQWREYRGLSQDRLVERVRERADTFSKSSLSRIENGRQPYSQDVLEALAWALECEPQDLLMRDPSQEDFRWSITDSLKHVDDADLRRLGEIVKTFERKAG